MLGKRLVTPTRSRRPELAREKPVDSFNPPCRRHVRPAQNRGKIWSRARSGCRAKRASAIALPRESASCLARGGGGEFCISAELINWDIEYTSPPGDLETWNPGYSRSPNKKQKKEEVCLGSFRELSSSWYIYGIYFNELYLFFSRILGFSVLTGLTVEKFRDTVLDHSLLRELIVP